MCVYIHTFLRFLHVVTYVYMYTHIHVNVYTHIHIHAKKAASRIYLGSEMTSGKNIFYFSIFYNFFHHEHVSLLKEKVQNEYKHT